MVNLELATYIPINAVQNLDLFLAAVLGEVRVQVLFPIGGADGLWGLVVSDT